jgi:hypothetical protein
MRFLANNCKAYVNVYFLWVSKTTLYLFIEKKILREGLF